MRSCKKMMRKKIAEMNAESQRSAAIAAVYVNGYMFVYVCLENVDLSANQSEDVREPAQNSIS